VTRCGSEPLSIRVSQYEQTMCLHFEHGIFYGNPKTSDDITVASICGE